ncbi:MAG TPA: DivIVA domain-containing protein [Candidatus Microbacterium pullistercoris]|nr:DivIVA domain-containing protein [Candidatus Microbacterium pullistercoris]
MTEQSVDTPFTREARARRGYDPEAVRTFLARARESFQSVPGGVSSNDIRTASFPLVRGGFSVPEVDAALARLEDAFAQREREAAIGADGADEWVADAREQAREILARVTRPEGRRFDRVSRLHIGYAPVEVDMVAERIARYLSRGDALTTEQLRTAAFHTARGGYREEQVDALLDATVHVILAVR